MAWMRVQVARVAVLWLAVHACMLVTVPTTLCSLGSVGAAKSDCSCPHAAGTVCPMHHPKTNLKSSKQCACKSAADPVAAMTSALLGPAAVLSPSASLVAPPDASAWGAAFVPVPIDPASVPDSPPPRA